LKDLPPSKFRIRFGGKGFGSFFTDALYDITIHAKKFLIPKDISGTNTSADKLIQDI
jgi:hypothetical protein